MWTFANTLSFYRHPLIHRLQGNQKDLIPHFFVLAHQPWRPVLFWRILIHTSQNILWEAKHVKVVFDKPRKVYIVLYRVILFYQIMTRTIPPRERISVHRQNETSQSFLDQIGPNWLNHKESSFREVEVEDLTQRVVFRPQRYRSSQGSPISFLLKVISGKGYLIRLPN